MSTKRVVFTPEDIMRAISNVRLAVNKPIKLSYDGPSFQTLPTLAALELGKEFERIANEQLEK